jgi:hypothetical protein
MTVTEASLAMAEGWIGFLTGIVVATLTGTVFAWSRGYLAEKAKNLATKEDIDELAKQIERKTTVVEEVKSLFERKEFGRRKELEYRNKQLSELYGPAYGYIKA